MTTERRDDAGHEPILIPLTRPRFREGQMLTAEALRHLEWYFDARQRLLSRLAVGTGVLCGLRLGPGDKEGELVLSPGVALDGHGRLIVVPEEVEIDPRRLTDERGEPAGWAEVGVVTVAVGFRAREIDGGAAVEETYAVLVLPGKPPRAGVAIAAFGGWAGLEPDTTPDPQCSGPAARWGRCCDEALGEWRPPFVVVGRVDLDGGADGYGQPLASPEGRRPIVDQATLVEMVLAICERLGQPPTQPAPDPSPTPQPRGVGPQAAGGMGRAGRPGAPRRQGLGTAQPGSGTDDPLRVLGVEFLDAIGRVVGALDEGLRPYGHPGTDGRGLAAFRVTFSRALAARSCTTADPFAASVLVRGDWCRTPRGQVSGALSVEGAALRFDVEGPAGTFPAGEYEVTLFGDDDPAAGRWGIAAIDGTRLDGEPRALPSGDGEEGGNFVFRFRVADA